MPRRQTTVEREVPLFLVPHMIMKRIKQHEEAMERIIVRKVGRHYYNISIRTKPVKRELMERKSDVCRVVPVRDSKEREQA
jgi:hypothetical protein